MNRTGSKADIIKSYPDHNSTKKPIVTLQYPGSALYTEHGAVSKLKQAWAKNDAMTVLTSDAIGFLFPIVLRAEYLRSVR
jgi:hypothetical protein